MRPFQCRRKAPPPNVAFVKRKMPCCGGEVRHPLDARVDDALRLGWPNGCNRPATERPRRQQFRLKALRDSAPRSDNLTEVSLCALLWLYQR